MMDHIPNGTPNDGFRESKKSLPLAGVKILELSRLLPGPWATMLCADYGATVIKIEEPVRGDYSRWSQPRYSRESVYFNNVNRNKRSVIIDLSSDEGKEIFYRLVERSDVVVEGFRPGVADRLGIGYEALSSKNPALIYCSVTGFGQSGPYGGHAGHDLNIAGLSGFLNHLPGDIPRVAGLQMGDFAGATMAVIALLLALRQRDVSGNGQYLDVSMFDGLVSWLSILSTSQFARLAGHNGEPALQAFGGNPRYAIYRTNDDKFLSVSLLESSFWTKFCVAVGREDLINPEETEEERLSDHGERGKIYRQVLTELFAQKGRDEWVAFLQDKGIPCFPVYSPDEVFSDPQVLSREMLKSVDHPIEGRIPQLGFPIKSSSMDPVINTAAPLYGQHTTEVMRELGYSDQEIALRVGSSAFQGEIP